MASDNIETRARRKKRIRKKIEGTSERPRSTCRKLVVRRASGRVPSASRTSTTLS